VLKIIETRVFFKIVCHVGATSALDTRMACLVSGMDTLTQFRDLNTCFESLGT
jgi:hypothetical protein